jgi:hypothetical protein
MGIPGTKNNLFSICFNKSANVFMTFYEHFFFFLTGPKVTREMRRNGRDKEKIITVHRVHNHPC